MRPLKKTLAAFAVALLIASCIQRPSGDSLYKKTAQIMATSVTITVRARTPEHAEAAIEAAFNEIRRLEALMSFWSEDSEIAAIYNNAGVHPVKVSHDTMRMVEISTGISSETGGAFDPTVGPLMRLWDFRKKTMPTRAQVQRTRGLVDYRRVLADKEAGTAYLEVAGMSFDTGGIAKGYAVDRAVEVLMAQGIGAGLVAIAGDIRGYGVKPGGGHWRVGIRDPRQGKAKTDVIATLVLRDEAVSTSGDYERYFVADGVRYHHILDPATGMPARGAVSVTVIAKEAVLADGYSTGVFVMGPKRGLSMLERLGMEGLVITGDDERFMTDGMGERISWDNW